MSNTRVSDDRAPRAEGRRVLLAMASGLSLVMAGAVPASGAETKVKEEKLGTFSLQVENDFFARNTATDRNYTNGLRLSWVSPPNERIPDWIIRPLSPPDPWFDTAIAPAQRRFGFAVGQSIYTPDNTEARALVRDDRPYAGWLYASFSYQSTYDYDFAGRTQAGLQDTFALELGVVGPAALGKETQNTFHRVINVSEANGWSNQLDNEPGINLIFERKYRTPNLRFPLMGGFGGDLIPNVSASIGNVATYASVGGIVRLGQGLAADFGPPRIRPSLPGSESFTPVDGPSWYLFVGGEGRAVARDVFLDGNTFQDSHNIDKRILVADIQAGLAVLIGGVRLSYTHVIRSPEFHGQGDWHQFGAVTISANF